MPSEGKSIGDQLAALLDETGISQRELGRRLATASKRPNFERRWKVKTRWVQKIVHGEVVTPTSASLTAIERALGRPGYFIRPERPSLQAKVSAGRATRDRRLEEVATQATHDVIQLRKDLNRAIRRIRALEKQAGGEGQSASEAR